VFVGVPANRQPVERDRTYKVPCQFAKLIYRRTDKHLSDFRQGPTFGSLIAYARGGTQKQLTGGSHGKHFHAGQRDN